MALEALESILSPEGGIGMMLYAKHGRQGLYQEEEMTLTLTLTLTLTGGD